MPFRDLALLIGLLGALPVCLLRPWIGVLAWVIVSFMNPHRLTWGFAYQLPFAQLVAVATLIGFIFTKDRKPFLWSRQNTLLVALWGWFTVTSFFAVYPESAWEKWEDVSKIILMALLSVPLFQDRRRLRILLLTIAGSIGFYGFKGGLFVLGTGGQWMILGPAESSIASNNDIALALNMCLPILIYLAREEPRRWLRLGLRITFCLSVIAVPFTYSRGGMLGLAVVLCVLFLKARGRLLLLPVVAVAILAFGSFAPQRWFDRMETLRDAQADESANYRLMSWRAARSVAADRPIVGGGFRVLHHRETYDQYVPEYPRGRAHDAHSIYFNLLGDHGVVGLGLFAVLMIFTFAALRRLRRLGGEHSELAWFSNYAEMLQASLIAYLVTGIFLSVAYFDLAYQFLVIVGILSGMGAHIARQPRRSTSASPAVVPSPLRLPLPVRLT